MHPWFGPFSPPELLPVALLEGRRETTLILKDRHVPAANASSPLTARFFLTGSGSPLFRGGSQSVSSFFLLGGGVAFAADAPLTKPAICSALRIAPVAGRGLKNRSSIRDSRRLPRF